MFDWHSTANDLLNFGFIILLSAVALYDLRRVIRYQRQRLFGKLTGVGAG